MAHESRVYRTWLPTLAAPMGVGARIPGVALDTPMGDGARIPGEALDAASDFERLVAAASDPFEALDELVAAHLAPEEAAYVGSGIVETLIRDRSELWQGFADRASCADWRAVLGSVYVDQYVADRVPAPLREILAASWGPSDPS